MVNNNIADRLADVLGEPREGLDVEVKNWLDLRSDEDAKVISRKQPSRLPIMAAESSSSE